MKNPVVFMDIEIDGVGIDRVTFELFKNIVPNTVENFRSLCTGERGDTLTTGIKASQLLTYNGSGFHRVIPEFMIQGGDFTNYNGTGGLSIFGGRFPDENFTVHHKEPFLLSMANSGKDTNRSQFFITLVECPWLDGKHVVFGKALTGQNWLKKMETYGSDSGKKTTKMTIKNCGQLE